MDRRHTRREHSIVWTVTMVLLGAIRTEAAQFVPIEDVILIPPTRIKSTLLRGGPGAFNAPRGNGMKHEGIDIVANQSSDDKEVYRVQAVSSGKVAYARINGTDETGYGYTVVIDHGNGYYTLYAHLAIKASKDLVKVGDAIKKGDTIGYMADLKNMESSSGNVHSPVVKPYDKLQLHFEVFLAEKGRTSDAALAPLKADATLLDPTERLKKLEYSSY